MLIPHSRSFFKTIPHPEHLSPVSRIQFSFPISHPVPRFPKSGKIPYPVKKSCVILFTEFRAYISVNSRIPRVLFKTLFSFLLFVRTFDCFYSVTQAALKKKSPSTLANSSRTYDLLVTQTTQMLVPLS